MQKISLTVKSFDSQYLTKALKHFIFLASFLNIKSIKRIDLPEKKKKITICRSPHIDKKSREQFQLRSHKSVLFFRINNKKSVLLFIECLKNSQIYGIEMSIDIHSNSFYTL